MIEGHEDHLVFVPLFFNSSRIEVEDVAPATPYPSIVNYLLYQAGWFACILGAAYGRPHAGFAIAGMLTIAHLVMVTDREREYVAISCAIAVGLVAEWYQISAGTYRIDAGVLSEGWPSPWRCCR